MRRVVISFDESDKFLKQFVDSLSHSKMPALSVRRKLLLFIGTPLLLIAFLFGYQALNKWMRRPAEGVGEKRLEITDLIRDVKQQVITASSLAEEKKETPFFLLKSVDLEINYTVKVSDTASGKAEFYVLTAENSSQTDLEKAQKIVLHLDAIQNYTQTGTTKTVPKIEETPGQINQDKPPPPK